MDAQKVSEHRSQAQALRLRCVATQAGAQMMEVLSSELDHRLPHDWPGAVQPLREFIEAQEMQERENEACAHLQSQDTAARNGGSAGDRAESASQLPASSTIGARNAMLRQPHEGF